MVTGGSHLNSSEILHSDGTSMCTLPPMPDIKFGHSQSAFTACGGGEKESKKICYTFREGRWETLNDQLELWPYEHASWMNENGDILLMGRGYEFECSHACSRVRNDLRIHYRSGG